MTSVQLSHRPLPRPTSATLTLVPGEFRIPPILRADVTAIQGFVFLAFLNFLYLFLTGLQTGQGLALAHRPHCVTVIINLCSSPLRIILSPPELSDKDTEAQWASQP